MSPPRRMTHRPHVQFYENSLLALNILPEAFFWLRYIAFRLSSISISTSSLASEFNHELIGIGVQIVIRLASKQRVNLFAKSATNPYINNRCCNTAKINNGF
ncbi:rh219 [macacine betaherpesvirus 3]|uniref:Rh219 n=1 Tax=Rhesus cytomegalovirus (strain 68-1) TaxID=47929 RepID=Q7TFC5_RHCM6|nr:rh219 [macacine betaherpesvirus 3]AAP50739.1 rh219 [macacine betaherpesvirus 3]